MGVNVISMAIEVTREQFQAAEQARMLCQMRADVLRLAVEASEGKLTMDQLLRRLVALVPVVEVEEEATTR